jgi:crotonobetainyl-CoA:carnitine CoA-transferase CaiB-like acyl-CoA transferase
MERHRRKGPLGGVRIIECSMLGPGGITTHLADLGAEVIKVEPPNGDYIREMTWPWVEGVSLMHLHISRGKRSIVLDLRTEEGKETFLDLVRGADVVVEAMRPGGLDRRGVGYEACKAINPKIVFCCISGYGATGPYRDLPSHGIAYDTWAGLVDIETTPEGFTEMPAHPNVGINVGPLFGALGILAGVTQARETGEGCYVEVAQSDAAAVMDWLAPETYKAYERPESEVTGNRSDGYARREPGTAGMKGGVRYQIYESTDGHVLFMASEKAFWKNFCEGVGRAELFEAHPGATYADHARGDLKLRAELTDIFKTKSTQEWIAFGIEVNTPIAPVNTPQTIADDPQFLDRLPWIPADVLGCEQLPTPLKFDVELPVPTKSPTLGQHTDDVLRTVLGYDDETIAARRKSGAFGPVDDAGT